MTGQTSFSALASRILLVLASTVVALVLCELALRIAGISYPIFDTHDELRGIVLRPGKEGWYRKEGEAYIQINSLGYRDVEHPIAKSSNTFRIAVLGDSMTEARQVALEHTFWSYLGQHLGSCATLGGKNVEVLNFGIGGYATTEELLTLRKDALRFDPDLVILTFFPGNDVHGNSRALSQAAGTSTRRPFYHLSNGQLVLDDSFRNSSGARLFYEAIHHLRTLELVNQARRVWVVKQMQNKGTAEGGLDLGEAFQIYSEPANEAWREAWQVTEALLAQMNREVAASGSRFILLVAPTPEQADPDAAVRSALQRRLGVDDLFYPDRKLLEIGRRHGFEVVVVADRVQSAAAEDNMYFYGFKNTVMGRGHWNETGHRLIGKLLVEKLCASGLTTQRLPN